MPINKNALLRYQVLDRCFRNPGRFYFWEDLVAECERALQYLEGEDKTISRRQIYEDIRFMESEQGFSIPLEKYKMGKRVYYRYSDTSFSIKNQPMNEAEAEQLKSALLVLSRFRGMPQFEWVNEMIPKLEQAFHLRSQEKEIISFDENQYLKGIEYIGALFNAILYKKVLKLCYKPFKSAEIPELIFHPWYLKQYNNRWFVFGFNENSGVMYNLALDRIECLEETTLEYRENTAIDFSEYFEDIIGVTKPEDEKPVKIVLHFSPEQAPYVTTKPLHGSQKQVSKDENGISISIEVIPNFELEKLILSFGDRVKVLEPAVIREQIREKFRKGMENHE